MYASEHAYLQPLALGTDFTFTSGPLSFVYTGLFLPRTFPWFVLGLVTTSAAIAAVIYVSERRWAYLLLFAVSVISFAPLSADSSLYLTPFAVFLAAVTTEGRAHYVRILVVPPSVLALAKFTAFALSVALLLLADMAELLDKRRPPLNLFLFVAACFVLYAAIGQPPEGFPSYIFNSLDVADGYARAMGNFVWSWRQTVYVSVAAILAVGSLLLAGVRLGARPKGFRTSV